MTDAAAPARRFLPPPLWGLLMLPFGLTVGFSTIAAPFVLRARGVPMSVIGTVNWVVASPHVLKPLWSPLLDSGPRRRSWFFGSVAASAVALGVTALIPPDEGRSLGPVSLLALYTAVLCLAQAAVATSGSAVLALMALTVPEARRGAAAGWQTAGNLAGTAAGGALVAWMLEHVSAGATALALGTVCLAASLPALLIDEVPPPKRSARRLMADLVSDVRRILRSRDGWTGMVICLSPVGAGALTSLFSALARDYAPDQASNDRLSLLVNGVFGGVANIAGTLAGGMLADRMNRRLAYALCGALSGLSAIAMILAPVTPAAFTAGCLAYQFTNGLCYAVFYAFVLELVGKGGEGVGTVTTQLALYIGAANLAAAYVGKLDTLSYDWAQSLLPHWETAGRAGMLAMDALTTFVGLAVLGAMTVWVRRSGPAAGSRTRAA